MERTRDGWSIRLPLRREEIVVDKRTVVGERVVIRRAAVDDVRRVEASVRREELRTDLDHVDRERVIDRPAAHRDTLAASGMDQEPLS
jgi:uncharacterized protein (TIGR02271 family)